MKLGELGQYPVLSSTRALGPAVFVLCEVSQKLTFTSDIPFFH